jgi:hypothetical protein
MVRRCSSNAKDWFSRMQRRIPITSKVFSRRFWTRCVPRANVGVKAVVK